MATRREKYKRQDNIDEGEIQLTGKVIHKEKDVTLVHKVSIDDCIADEVEILNNVYDIFTLSSCCGHGDTPYISCWE